mmetsp:Transcript_28989/g.52780  ORF Transcript_28989/g.52780 Transcript_28989/m.52780 type:complete len:414 (-) Transcript_28989:77-1318(-)
MSKPGDNSGVEVENQISNKDEAPLSHRNGRGIWTGISEGYVSKAVAMFEGASARAAQEAPLVRRPTSQRMPLSLKGETANVEPVGDTANVEPVVTASQDDGACSRHASPEVEQPLPEDPQPASPPRGGVRSLSWQPSLLEGDSQHAADSDADRETEHANFVPAASTPEQHCIDEEAGIHEDAMEQLAMLEPITMYCAPEEADAALRTRWPLCTRPSSVPKDKEERRRLERRLAWCSSGRIARSQAPKCRRRDPPRARSACKSLAAEQCQEALRACAIGRELLAEAPTAGLRSRLEAIARLAERIQREEEWVNRVQSRPEPQKRALWRPPNHVEVGLKSQERQALQLDRRRVAEKCLPEGKHAARLQQEAAPCMQSARASSIPPSSQRSSLTPRLTARSYVLVPATEQIRPVVA